MQAQTTELPIFTADTPLVTTLIFDKKLLARNKYKEEYQPVSLVYSNNEGNQLSTDTIELKMRTRGNSRKSICQFPPLKLNFDTKKTSKGIFSGLDKVKLVSYCKDNKLYEQYILKEYYTYKLYSILSEKAYRTRLLKITYQDILGKKKKIIRYGFLIEDDESVAERLNSHPFKTAILHPDNCNKVAVTKLALFQYMIGNTDWSVAMQHNVHLFVPKINSENLRPFAIPYDFDYSGLVDAHYAMVSRELPVSTITDRYYLGYCCEDIYIKEAIADFKSKKHDMLQVLENDTLLDVKHKNKMLAYLQDFFNQLDNPEKLIQLLNTQCKR